jgi:hypothetical protein
VAGDHFAISQPESDSLTGRYEAMKLSVSVAFATVALGSSGCLGTKSYVDPSLPKVAFTDVAVPIAPRPVALTVQFKRNAEAKDEIAKAITPKIVEVLNTSRAFSKVETAADEKVDRLTFVLHNIYESSNAKAFGTGLTFGLVGSKHTDNYEFTATFTPAGKAPAQKTYQHAIHTTVGNSEIENLTPMSTQAAVNKVLEDLVLSALRDFQRDGLIGGPGTPRS